MANNAMLGILIKAQDQFSGTFGKLNSQVKGVNSSLASMSTALKTLGVGIGAAAFVKLGSDSLKLAADKEEVRGSFDALTRAAGISGQTMLSQLRTASRGMSSELDLIKTANRALLADISAVTSNIDTVYKFAAAGADALGISTTEAFDRITKSISAMQSRGLKEFGIGFDQGQVMDAYAASMGKVASELSQTEQEAAFAEAAVAEMEKTLARTGDSALSTGDKIDILNSSIADLKVAFGEAIADSSLFGDALSWLTAVVKEWQVMGDYGEANGFLAQMGLAFGNMNTEMDALRQQFREGQISAAEYENGLRRLLGLLGGVSGASIPVFRAPALSGGGMRAPSATMFGGSPAQYGYGSKTIAQQEQVVAEYNERQAEALRRKGEYQSRYNSLLSEQRAILDQIRSRAESVLTGGVNVTQQDMLDTEAGTYQNKPLEAARRLADIVNKGMASPWAAIIVPPAEIIAQGDAAVKAWAARTREQVVNLARPDLIDWGAFIEQYKAALAGDQAKEDTLNIAMKKLSEAGLLKGADKNKVAEMLGLGTPQSAGEMFASGFAEGVGNKDLANLFLSAWQTDFDAKKTDYESAGQSLGGVLIVGVKKGVEENMPGVRQQIAYYVAPEVAKILAQQDGAKP